jgi:hypothetical protein
MATVDDLRAASMDRRTNDGVDDLEPAGDAVPKNRITVVE